jgi:telomeric repeat-binding factor 2
VREAFGFHDGVFNNFKPNRPESPPISGIEEKLMDISSSEETTADTSGEVGITDNEKLESDKSDKDTTLRSSKINNIQNALKARYMKLKNVANGLNVADSAASELKGAREKGNAPNPSIDNDGFGASVDDNDNLKCKLAHSIMEPNSTARTDKWVDSIDELSEEGSSSEPDKSKSPSPKNRNASLLTINKSKKISKRRQKKIWSTIEEDTLRTGVQKYGKGNWKLILNMYREIFEERNEVNAYKFKVIIV